MIIDTAGVEEKIMIYDYACLAANNSFFLDNLVRSWFAILLAHRS